MIIKSNFLKPDSGRTMTFLKNYYLETDIQGHIIYFGNDEDLISDIHNRELNDLSHKIILPGMIDLHTHIPQYPALGIGKGTLLNWLDNHIFPLEIKFNNAEYAYKLSEHFFNDCLKLGTTTVVAYSNSSYEGTDVAFKAAKKTGIRAFIGNSLMDMNVPEAIKIDTDSNISNSLKLIKKWNGENSDMLNYIITPRYALVCSEKLMQFAGKIATDTGLFIQTHLAENKEELRQIYKTYPDYNSYTDIYDKAGLLTQKSIFAHCIYLSDYEINLIKDKAGNIVHCPSSNRYLKSGVFPLRKMSRILKTGIGTDVAAGTSLSMLDEIKEAIETDKTYQIIEGKNEDNISPCEALWIATKGNAEILSIENETGDFEIGLSADLVVIDINKLGLDFNLINDENISGKIIYELGKTFADEVFIRGKSVYKNHKNQI